MNVSAFNLSETNILDVIGAAKSSDLPVMGKHEDSTVVFNFNHDSNYIYASDVDAPEVDLFANCHIADEFASVLSEHGLCLESMKEYFKPLFESDYEFSNANESGSASLKDVLN